MARLDVMINTNLKYIDDLSAFSYLGSVGVAEVDTNRVEVASRRAARWTA